VEAREQRGLVIAARSNVHRKGRLWQVPSAQEKHHGYLVNLDAKTCTCLDHQEGGYKCKHIYAAEIVFQREFEFNEDGSVTETTTLTTVEQMRKTTYPQQWAAYNAAQTSEKATFQRLLHDLCKSIPESTETRLGRPRLPLRDGIFAACFKVYSMLSSRRFTSDLCDAHGKGYISRVPHFNSVLNVFDSAETAEILTALVSLSAAPLAAIESNFAVDSSGFSGCRFDQWYAHKWKNCAPRITRAWVKAHAMIGVTTNVVTAVQVLDKDSNDHPMLQPLMKATAERFQIGDVCADKAYLSESNLQAIADIGGSAFIPFKSNSAATRPGIWNNAFHYFNLHREAFLTHYHQRSNIESTFSMIKRKFGDSVKAKNDQSMICETLAKFVCHNLCCLIQSMQEFGIDHDFGCTKITAPAQKVS
jgi:transposase